LIRAGQVPQARPEILYYFVHFNYLLAPLSLPFEPQPSGVGLPPLLSGAGLRGGKLFRYIVLPASLAASPATL